MYFVFNVKFSQVSFPAASYPKLFFIGLIPGKPVLFLSNVSFDFQYYMTYKMVYSIDSTHLNYGHVYCADF